MLIIDRFNSGLPLVSTDVVQYPSATHAFVPFSQAPQSMLGAPTITPRYIYGWSWILYTLSTSGGSMYLIWVTVNPIKFEKLVHIYYIFYSIYVLFRENWYLNPIKLWKLSIIDPHYEKNHCFSWNFNCNSYVVWYMSPIWKFSSSATEL